MPIKVMLVDDEIIVRIGMKSAIDWEGNGFRYAGEAGDGVEALALLDRINPDILLTDIKMPNMNGIELIKEVKRKRPEIRIIVLSSHDEFDYVRSAMKLGADDYILKASVDPDKLIHLLRETASRIEPASESASANPKEDGHTSSPRETLEDLLCRCMEGEIRLEDMNRQALLESFSRHRAYIALARVTEDETTQTAFVPPAAAATLGHVLELNAQKWVRTTLARSSEREVVLVLWLKDEISAERLREIGKDLASAAGRFTGIAVDIGFSGGCESPGKLAEGYNEAAQALETSFFGTGEHVYIHAEQGLNNSSLGVSLISRQDEKELVLAVEQLDEEAIRHKIDGILANVKIARPPIAQAIQACLDLFYTLQTAFRKLGIPEERQAEGEQPAYSEIIGFTRIRLAEQWFEHYVAQNVHRVRSASRERGREEILALVTYMKDHYSERMTLKQAAARTMMSEGYLSFLFKKETGTGLIEFLNGLRIDKAAELLRNTHLPSYAIAEKVGYDNFNYFGRIFKKVKGMSPKRYRANFIIGSTTSIPSE
ncbi:response regulator [Paenibacillus nasutitermitis]|uniref:Response regulator n=1 Tax=Paenibacillus nasutitermitis TaxID=1652958 RepID=A0A916YSL0_9BACL|nr:response regulator [Paenibacillus nasutitermitis]GGD59239.1 hypothetical protein GCM10010911_16320 [Paenibacillus nasutitermitis]